MATILLLSVFVIYDLGATSVPSDRPLGSQNENSDTYLGRGRGGKYPDTVYTENVRIRGSTIFGSIYAYRDAYILVEDSEFLVDYMRIELRNDSKMVIRDCKINPNNTDAKLYIYLYDNAELVIEDTFINSTLDYFVIYLYNSSRLRVENSGNLTDVRAFDIANITITGKVFNSDFSMNDISSIHVINAELNKTTISGGGISKIWISNSKINETIYVWDSSHIIINDSYIYWLDANEFAWVELKNVTGFEFEFNGESYFIVDKCNVTYIKVRLYEYTTGPGMRYLGSHGKINNTDISNLEIYSFSKTHIENSNVTWLYYANVYTGYLRMNKTNKEYGECYDTYTSKNSNILAKVNDTDYLFVWNVTELNITGATASRYIYMLNVSNAYISHRDGTSLMIYAWNSDITMYNLTHRYFRVYAYNTSIEGEKLNATRELEISLNLSYAYITNISAIGVSSNNIDMETSSITLQNATLDLLSLYSYHSFVQFVGFNLTNLNRFKIRDGSVAYLLYGEAYGCVECRESIILTYNVTLTELFIEELNVSDGNFTIVDGLIVEYDGSLQYGAINYGNTTITDKVVMHNLFAKNASLNVSGVLSEYDSSLTSDFYAEINTSDVIFYNVSTIDINAYMYFENSNITMYKGLLDEVEICRGNAIINDTEVSRIIIANTTLEANNSRFSEINIDGNITMKLYTCNVTGGIHSEVTPDILLLALIPMSNIDIDILKSNISEIGIFGRGEISINESTVEYLYVTFHNTTLYNTNVTKILLNTTLFKSGSIEIRNNKIVSGVGTKLLTLLGDCNIATVTDAIVIDEDPPSLGVSLSVSNSKYFAIVAIGGNVTINSSYFNMIMISNGDHVYIYNTTSNSSIFTDMPALSLNVADCVIDNSTFIGMGISLVNGTFYMNDTKLNTTFSVYFGCNAVVEHTNATSTYIYTLVYNSSLNATEVGFGMIEIYNADLRMSSSSATDMLITDSICIVNKSKIYGKITLYENTTLSVYDSEIDRLGLSAYEYGLPGNILVHVEGSKIDKEYFKWYYTSDYTTAIFDNETISGSYGAITTYINVDTTGAKAVMCFEVIEHGKAEIWNYTGASNIGSITVNTTWDKTPPTITCTNGTSIEYEYGLGVKLEVNITDETPKEYIVYLNGTQILKDTYTETYTLIINLQDYITGPGKYNLTVYACDYYDNDNKLTIIITAHSPSPPAITFKPSDNYTIDLGQAINLSWTAEDASPDTYSIYLNGSLVESGSWSSGDTINYTFTATVEGEYVNITIVFTDKLGQETHHTVTIRVPIEPPVIISEPQSSYIINMGDNITLEWIAEDATPDEYRIYLNDELVQLSPWSSGETISYMFFAYTEDSINNVTIIFYDEFGQTARDTVIITVYAPPRILSMPEDSYTISVGDKITLEWTAEDATPSFYVIYVNGEKVSNETWTSGATISYEFEATKTGTYNITIVFYDQLGQKTSDTVMIEVKEKAGVETETETKAEKKAPSYLWLIALAILIVAVMVVMYMKKKKSKT